MRRIIPLVLCTALILALAACGGTADKKQGDSMGLEEIFKSILTGVENLPEVGYTEVNSDNYNYYLSIDPVEGAEALADDAVINAIPHSAVLLRVPDGTDAAAVAKEVEQKADLRKWICVSAEKAVVKVHGNTILLVMSTTETADEIAANFDELWA